MISMMVSEFHDQSNFDGYVFDLNKQQVKECIGCWSCWLKTPGKCIQKDLELFYQSFFQADRAVFLIKESCGFISGNLKNLFDRMIVEALPYIKYDSGESMHRSRYSKVPFIEIYYYDTFEYEEDKTLFIEYLNRVFYQFNLEVRSIKAIMKGEIIQ